MPCQWRAQIGVWRSGEHREGSSGFDKHGWPPAEWTPRGGVVELVAWIEHRSIELAVLLRRIGRRPVRVMMWTHDEITGHPRQSQDQWTRVTMDDLSHVTTRRGSRPGAQWVSWFCGPQLSPIVDVADLPAES